MIMIPFLLLRLHQEKLELLSYEFLAPLVSEVARKLGYSKPLIERNAVFTSIFSPDTKETIDKAILLYFKGPHSFTGEDVLELHIHGSRAVIKDTLAILGSMSELRLAEPGEFSKRAFTNGKMDLTEAEGLVDLINAETSMQRRVAMRQFGGELYNLYEFWRSSMIKLQAQLEAFIDFPEDDIPKSVVEDIKDAVKILINAIEKHLDPSSSGEVIVRGIKIAIVGEANAGKSSLMNSIAKREVAIVSHREGTTRDVVETSLDLNGFHVNNCRYSRY